MKRLAQLALVVALICALVLVILRWGLEQSHRTVLIAVDLGDAQRVGLSLPPGVVYGLDLREEPVFVPPAEGLVVVTDGQQRDQVRDLRPLVTIVLAPEVTVDQGLWGVLEFAIPPGLGGTPLRCHQLPKDALADYDPDGACDRFLLAVRERGISILYVYLFADVADPVATNQAYLEQLITRLEDAGFSLGVPQPYSSFQPGLWTVLLLALGVWSVVYLSLDSLGLRGDLLVLGGLFLSTLGARLVGGDVLVRQVLALLVTLVFPVYGIRRGKEILEKEKRFWLAMGRGLGQVFLVTVLGALFLGALLADTRFMLGLAGFRGVKLAGAVPPVAVFLLAFKGQRRRKIRWYLLFPVGLAFVYYLLRTGTGLAPILQLERSIRQFLTEMLVVRPRFKEFLVGYPALWVAYGWLAKGEGPRALWLATGSLAPISVLNSFCHAHTPLTISLYRSALGLVLGIPLGMVLWCLVNAGDVNGKGGLGRLLRLR
ncbi:MAG TPA: hypothetical protein GXX57_00555 [Firmicutes bacterium]|nr:hypothetical protein [Bacillota bacterium]